jgi:predicted DNA-binding ribbon-helix-helix protein
MIVKRSVSLQGHRTSISLEPEFFAELDAIAARRGVSLAALVTEVDGTRARDCNLSSALRLFVLAEAKAGPIGSAADPSARRSGDYQG